MVSLKDEYSHRRRVTRRERRRAHYRAGLRPIAIAGWETSKEHNVGTLVRMAHAAAASEVILIGEKEWNVEAARTAQNYTEIVLNGGLPASTFARPESVSTRAPTLGSSRSMVMRIGEAGVIG